MTGSTPDGTMDALLGELEREEPVSFSLGTPELLESDAVRTLVGLGPAIVPLLLERLRAGGPSKRLAYIALVLNRIGDARALAPLRELRASFQARQPKDEWDHAVIGQCNLALHHLENRGQ